VPDHQAVLETMHPQENDDRNRLLTVNAGGLGMVAVGVGGDAVDDEEMASELKFPSRGLNLPATTDGLVPRCCPVAGFLLLKVDRRHCSISR
jgi:hypothetical protein